MSGESAENDTIKPFGQQGHYTAVHDAVFDVVMPMCPPNAFKVLMFVVRKTVGWQKHADSLSYSQIREGCGIASDSTVRSALKWLTHHDHRLLNAHSGRDHLGKREIATYSLNTDYEIPAPATESKGGTTKAVERTTEIEESPATESKDGPATEPVETITTGDNNHTREPVVEAVSTVELQNLPDDTTAACLLLLDRVKGFPKDKAENAAYLAELREECPNANPVEVCREFETWHRDNPSKTKNYRSRLRNFFKKKHNDSQNGNGGNGRQNGHAKPGSNGAGRESEYLKYFDW